MTIAPDDDLYTFLTGKVTPALFKGPVRPTASDNTIPSRAMFLLATGGRGPSNYTDGTLTAYRFFRVLITVRSEANAFQTGRDDANALWALLHEASIAGYTRVVCETSAPVYGGRNDHEEHQFFVPVIMERRG